MRSAPPQLAALRRAVRRRRLAATRAVVRPRGRQRVTGVVESVEAYVRDELREPARFELLRAAHQIERRPPRSADGAVHPTLARLATHRHPAIFRARLPGARIAAEEPLTLTADRRALLESTFDREQLDANAVMAQRLHPARHRAGEHVCLVSQWSTNFFHWMLDTLPRLALVDAPADTPIVIPDAHGAIAESLALAGIAPERLVRFDGTHLSFDELHFPSLVGGTGNPPRWALEWLRDTLAPAPTATPRRLYVSRADATWRRVVDEPAVEALLAQRGFETVLPGELRLADQLRLFSEAEAIVGPHGAGLVNLFAARDATLVELMPDTWVNGCYYAMAGALDLPYWYLVTESQGRHDLRVDLAALTRTLDAAGL